MKLSNLKLFLAASVAAPVAAIALNACADQSANPDLACRMNADGGAETYSRASGEVIYQLGDNVNQTSDTIYGTAYRVGGFDIEAPAQVALTANTADRKCYIGESPDAGIPMTGPSL